MSKHHNEGNSTSSLHQKLNAETESVDLETEEGAIPELISHESYLELQKKLIEAEEKASQSYDRMLRSQAEIDNIQRRAARDLENAHKYGQEKLILELLPVIDSMERSLEVDGHKVELEGVALTLKIFQAALQKFGVEVVSPMNEPFNPEFHQAVSVQPNKEVAPNTVLGVLQKGYTLNKRLIRPAFVMVSQ